MLAMTATAAALLLAAGLATAAGKPPPGPHMLGVVGMRCRSQQTVQSFTSSRATASLKSFD